MNNARRKVYICSTTNLCEINHYHVSRMHEFISGSDYEIVDCPDDASDILVMTCGALAISEDRSVRKLESLKQAHPEKKIFAMGCLASINPNNKAFEGTSVIPANKLESIADEFEIEDLFNEVRPIKINYDLLSIKSDVNDRFTLLVEEGCLGACTYCAIRKAKGNVQSVPEEVIVEQFKRIVENNIRPTIALLGEDFGSYGQDKSRKQNKGSAVDLLDRLTAIEGEFSIEIQNFEPSRFLKLYPDLKEIFGRGKVVKMHVAVQSGSQQVLKKMNRRYDVKRLLQALHEVQIEFPEMLVETSFIINFPGESREDFQKTATLLPIFDEVMVYNYSPRTGTKAKDYKSTITKNEMELRKQVVREIEKVHRGLCFM